MNSISSQTHSKMEIVLGGFPLQCTTATELKKQLASSLDTHQQQALFFANTNFIVKCQPLQTAMRESPTIIVNDGIGVDIATWLVHRKKFLENLNGTDFIPDFLHHVNHSARVFLIGGKPGIAVRAAQVLNRSYNVNVVGSRDGYGQAQDTEALVADINAADANVVLIAMGNPAQERWIMQQRAKLNARVLIGVGALFDFLAGDKPRAPKFIQKLRLEWFYRLCLEPARLMRRYTIDIAVFLALCIRAEKHQQRMSHE